MCEGNHLLISQKIHTHTTSWTTKNVVRVFPFILKTEHKTLHVKRAWAELENSTENILPKFRSIESNSGLIEPDRIAQKIL